MSIVGAAMAFVSGVLMAVQGSINAGLGKDVGVLRATLVVHLVGSVVALMLVLLPFLRAPMSQKWTEVPWVYYLGGVLGVAIVYLVAISIPPLGVAVATTMIIVGQVGTALLIDHLGALGLNRLAFTWQKGMGLILLAAGAGLLLKK
ncbi:MAG: DMT family transporter [Firmicutes bacterium]|nr:DMT family transporter [Dethiobacter sp.]MBS3889110.1 DMT family transporter [Bacillota bacterium]